MLQNGQTSTVAPPTPTPAGPGQGGQDAVMMTEFCTDRGVPESPARVLKHNQTLARFLQTHVRCLESGAQASSRQSFA